jgi:hypothetical protein
MSTLCYMFVNDLQNSEQCTMLVSFLGKGSMCIVRTRHINSVGYVLIFKWGFLVWQKLTGVLGFLRHFFLRCLQILVSSLWLEHSFLSCRVTYYILGSVSWWSSRSGDYVFWKSLARNARCASFQNLTSLILWIYFIALWTRCDFSEFFFPLFFQMPERVHKNVDWKQSPNLHSEAHSFVGSACQGDSMEWCRVQLVAHFEECSAGVTVKCEFILWELHWTFLIILSVAGLNLP